MFTIASRIGLIVTLLLMLGADHLTLDGGVGDLKKNFLQALVGRKKLHAAQM